MNSSSEPNSTPGSPPVRGKPSGSQLGGSQTEYIVVARRYRPQTFTELIGQGQVTLGLTNAIAQHRVGHAYLFTGARGTGKTSTARIFAKALVCERGPTASPCNQCDMCLGIAGGDDVDVLEIDGASNRGIDEIRQLRSNVNIRPSRARFKIYIIDEVHMLTTPAFNALLKTLEEPPEHVKFIFCTTDPEKIPITVLSRCQRFDFAPVEKNEILGRLREIVASEGVEAEPAALEMIARRANGSMRDSQSLLEQLLSFATGAIGADDVYRMLGIAKSGRVQSLTQRLIARDGAGALAELDAALGEGVDVGQFAEQLLGYFRDMMASLVGCPDDLLLQVQPGEAESLRADGQAMGLETTLAAMQILDSAVTRLRHSPHARAIVEMACVRICSLADLDRLAAIVARMESGVSVIAPARPAAPTPPPAKKKTEPDDPTIAHRPSPTAGDRRDNISASTVRIDSAQTSPWSPKSNSALEASAAVAASFATERAVSVAPEAAFERKSSRGINADLAEALDDARWMPDGEPAEPVPIQRPREDSLAATLPPESSVTAGHPASAGFTVSQATEWWRQATADLGDLTGDAGSFFSHLAILAPNRLAIYFPEVYNTHKEMCARPERKLRLEQSLASVAKRSIQLEFHTHAETAAEQATMKAAPATRLQRLRERQKHPFVREAMQMFDADITRVD